MRGTTPAVLHREKWAFLLSALSTVYSCFFLFDTNSRPDTETKDVFETSLSLSLVSHPFLSKQGPRRGVVGARFAPKKFLFFFFFFRDECGACGRSLVGGRWLSWHGNSVLFYFFLTAIMWILGAVPTNQDWPGMRKPASKRKRTCK